MKKLLTMLSVICVFAITLTAIAFSTSAAGPNVKDGDIIEAQGYVDSFHEATTPADKLEAAKELNVYLFARPVSRTTSIIILEKIYGNGEAEYAEFSKEVEKIMAYGAASVMTGYAELAEDTPIYLRRNIANWASRFMEYKIEDYTREEVLAEDFFAPAAAADETAPEGEAPDGEGETPLPVAVTLGDEYAAIAGDVESRLAAALDSLSNEAFAEYEDPKIMQEWDLMAPSFSFVTNGVNTNYAGVAYENGYRRDDFYPSRDYILTGIVFAPTAKWGGLYDKVPANTYVIFDEGVTDYYVGTTNNFEKRLNVVKRNYVYDNAVGDYVQVPDGEGLYDFIEEEGFAQLLVPDPYHHYDMTGKYVTSGVPYGNWGASGVTSAVFEFDYSFFDTDGYLSLSFYSKNTEGTQINAGGVVQFIGNNIKFGQAMVDADGVSRKSGYVLEDVIVPGRWTTVQLAITGKSVDVYLDYEYFGTLTIGWATEPASVVGIRAMLNGTSGVGCAVDNLMIYRGSMPRDYYKFAGMGDRDKFVYYANYLAGEGGSATAKLYAYRQMEAELLKYFTLDPTYEGDHIAEDGTLEGGLLLYPSDTALTEAIKLIYTYDIDAIIEEYRTTNVGKYAELVDRYAACERLYSSLSAREAAKNEIYIFYTKCCDLFGEPIYIDVDSEEFQKAEEKKLYYDQLLENDQNSYKFVEAMEAYGKFSKYKKKFEKYSEAESILKSTVIDNSITAAGETKLTEAYAAYNNAPEALDAILKQENSKNLAMYLDYTTAYDTIESWEENYDKLSYPISKAREIISSGKYLTGQTYPQYGDLDQLVAWYYLINDFFYDKLQEEHIAYLKTLHEKYNATESYMEKLGICTEVDRYLDEEDIDPTNQQLSIIRERNDGYLEEIKDLEEPFLAQRDKNTELFIAVVKKFASADSYNEIVEYLDEAIDYYYTMTVGATDTLTDEEVAEAVETYNYYIEYEKKIVDSTAQFILLATQLEGCNKLTELYNVVADMAQLVEYVSADIEGAAEALAAYEAAYARFEAAAVPVRAELSEVQSTVISLRANAAASALINLFEQLFNKVAH